MSARDEGRRGSHSRENAYVAWLMGYVTAYNRLTADTYDIEGHCDLHTLLPWLEDHCKAHPLISFPDAVETLTNTLYPNRLKSTSSE